MKVIFENKYEFTETQINIPFIVGETPIGVINEVNKDTFTVQIFDKFIGLEILNNNVEAIYLSEKEQISYEEFISKHKGENVMPKQNELKLVITKLSNIIWNYADHGERMTKDSIIESIKKIVDDYNALHGKKINY